MRCMLREIQHAASAVGYIPPLVKCSCARKGESDDQPHNRDERDAAARSRGCHSPRQPRGHFRSGWSSEVGILRCAAVRGAGADGSWSRSCRLV